ncbi:fungal-specific transcription factor domain-containing protein [Daldinia decipiens]|uniref:fungal-specific transcription factor domain-containing protein n=1 Tax=Daldinia decipiens TaxID=326647 RepID=UPI0020C42537|nr:fungal-specific transcription factor domain-containing protein [Daldinia decipiens]KAI1658520.1 fungal-specific transcription factor domain-containing protein [Daldinia decipiens]
MDLDSETMPPRSPPSPDPHPSKRQRASSPDKDSPSEGNGAPTSPTAEHSLHDGASQSSKLSQSTSFRNVSACNRCRLRKNRCDQKLPSCASCEKARVACVGYDPITKREIPRSYVYYLETRVDQLETLLRRNNIQFPPANNLEYCSRPGTEGGLGRSPTDGAPSAVPGIIETSSSAKPHKGNDDVEKPTKIMRPGGSGGQRHLGSATGISFARVVFAAVQSSVSDQRSNSDKTGVRPYRPIAGNGAAASGTSMRDSFFGLHTRPTIRPAEFPPRDLAIKMVDLYFQHANPQIPVLHRENFMQLFERAYAEEGRIRGPKELYILNMVYAIGGGIIMDAQTTSAKATGEEKKQAQPEEYHASAVVHLEACLSNSGGGLEELQAVLLLANFALLRPVPPGLWYIVGVAVRLAVDLGLHYEDGKDVEFDLTSNTKTDEGNEKSREACLRERGRREYTRDLRRRLWWSTYSLDRLVSTCVGRPFGVSDQVITTEFPSLLDDRYITSEGFKGRPAEGEPTYKIVAKHYFRLRLLQSEILQVLQYQQTQMARFNGQNTRNEYMHTQLPSPFLHRFDSFRNWRRNIDQRLYDWKNSAPTKQDSGVAFHPEFLELNYWQTIIMLYRQSLSVPSMFEGEYNTSKEVNSPSIYAAESREDEERVYVKVAEAGQKILRLYRQLHLMGLVNYTYLATHHLFMAGISYLYAIWHSHVVRSRLTMDEVDFTILAATSVFTDLIEKCPPAEACRDAFDRTAKATIKMANSTGGFGQVLHRSKRSSRNGNDYINARDATANRHKAHHRASLDHTGSRTTSSYNTPGQESYSSHDTSQISSIQAASQASGFRLSMPKVKTEQDGYSMMRTMPQSTLSTASLSDVASLPDNSAIDPVLLPSPGAHTSSPVSINSLTPQSNPGQPYNQNTGNSNFNFRSPATTFTPSAAINYSDLQGMDFLQGIQEQPNADGVVNADLQMDMGFGLGWEGMHHDFSDGQQVDLFDGFFFGGQQGGG